LHDAAGRTNDRDTALRAALALDPTDGETRELSARWGVGLGLVHRGEVYTSTDNTVTLPGYARVDAAVYCELGFGLRAQLNVENLADVDYFASANNNTNITPGSPRAARLALTARF